jgi:hypothetical protein
MMMTRLQLRTVLNRIHRYKSFARQYSPPESSITYISSVAHRTQSLAQFLIQRYASLEQRWPLIALIFQLADRITASVPPNNVTAYSSFFINPQVSIRMLAKQQMMIPTVIKQQGQMQLQNRKAFPRMQILSSKLEKVLLEQNLVANRIIQRTIRDETQATENIRLIKAAPSGVVPQILDRSTVQAKVSSPERIYRRSAEIKNEAASIKKPENTGDHKNRENAASRDRNSGTSQPSVDITRITDQVLQALDRRIVAQRERMGRI